MRLSVLSFFIGILYCHTLATLPNVRWLLAFGMLFSWFWILSYWPTFASAFNNKFTVFYKISARLVFFFILGCFWLTWRAELVLSHTLPAHLEGQDLTIVGEIDGFPKQEKQGWRFDFTPHAIFHKDVQQTFSLPRIRLYWFGQHSLQPNALCTLKVRLKRPHTTLNFGVPDYSRYLFFHQIRAKGYVKKAQACVENTKVTVDTLRFKIAHTIKQSLGNHPSTGIIIGLAIGEKQWISQEQWDVLRNTGTIHLVVISGLHIGLIAGFGFFIGRFIWKHLGHVSLWIPAQRIGILLGLIAALFYALLAGFLLPTQRALIMLTLFATNALSYRSVPISHILFITLLLILLWNPFEITLLGLWLSFGSVALIIYGVSQTQTHYKLTDKSHKKSKLINYLTNFSKVQWTVIIGMVPMLLFFMGYFPLTSFIANAIAIPWIGLVIIPLIFISMGLLYIVPTLGQWTLQLCAEMFDASWTSLHWLAEQPWGIYESAIPPLWAFMLAGIGVLIILLPKGFPARWIGVFWLLPLFFHPKEQLPAGAIQFTLLDVGQGLSAVIRTQHHTLVYDAGPKIKAPVVPFFKSQGIRYVDKLIISHANRDHSHGALYLTQQLNVNQLMSSQPDRFSNYPVSDIVQCQTKQIWWWDGVKFEILHPRPDFSGDSNAMSCVLKIVSNGGSILLTGDIGKHVEYNLVTQVPEKLSADLLVVPHHGSKNSSTERFIQTVNPKIALFSSGYRNSFNHPHPSTLQRYQKYAINWLNTPDTGAIQFQITEKGISEPTLAKEARKRYWHEY